MYSGTITGSPISSTGPLEKSGITSLGRSGRNCDPSRYWINLLSSNWEATGKAQFILTDTEGVYQIKNLSISDGTAYYAITESVWADTKVNTTACTPGTYDVTYEPATGIVTMTASAPGAVSKWNLYSWNETDGNIFRPFVTTDNPNVFVLENFEMGSTGYSFSITTTDWTPVYGNNWAESVQATGVEYALTTQDQVNTWMALPEGKYRMTFTLTESGATLKAEAAGNDSGISDIEADANQPTRYFTLQGIEVGPSALSAGLYIVTDGTTPARKLLVK